MRIHRRKNLLNVKWKVDMEVGQILRGETHVHRQFVTLESRQKVDYFPSLPLPTLYDLPMGPNFQRRDSFQSLVCIPTASDYRLLLGSRQKRHHRFGKQPVTWKMPRREFTGISQEGI